MANHKQAVKRHRQSQVRAARNRYFQTTLRGLLKKARNAIAEQGDNVQDTAKAALKLIDRVATKGIIPKGRANRLKSRLESQAARLD